MKVLFIVLMILFACFCGNLSASENICEHILEESIRRKVDTLTEKGLDFVCDFVKTVKYVPVVCMLGVLIHPQLMLWISFGSLVVIKSIDAVVTFS